MMTAQRLLPSSVGVAPGTTAFTLGGPWNYQACNSPARAAQEQARLFPPGKYPATEPGTATATSPRCRGRWSPYAVLDTLKGGLGRALGIVVTPFEYTQAGKNRNYCSSRPGRGPDYGGAGGTLMGSPSQLGAIPTDFDLSKQYGYMPMMHQWIPFKQGTWTTPPFIQPDGNWGPNPKIDSGIWAPALPQLAGPQLGQEDVVDQPSDGTIPMDPATAAVLELKRHQDRMYLLGIVSAAAVASTALINVFRYNVDRRSQRRRDDLPTARARYNTRVAAEPAPVISGTNGNRWWRKRRR